MFWRAANQVMPRLGWVTMLIATPFSVGRELTELRILQLIMCSVRVGGRTTHETTDWIQPDLPSLGKEVETTRQVQFESCQETDLTIWRSFPTCRSPLHYVHLTCFVRCNCDGMSDVTRDNYHCCCIYAGELTLNSLVLWMLVKHYDPL